MKTTIKNKYQIDIVQCCASCAHNIGMDTEKTRICDAGEGIVKPSSYCKGWAMRKGLDKAGKAGGRVKKLSYLTFVLEYQQPEGRDPLTVDEKRAEYMEKFGSIYLNKR